MKRVLRKFVTDWFSEQKMVIAAGSFFGLMSDRTARFGRDSIVFLGTSVHVLAFVAIFINFPAEANLQKTNETAFIEPRRVLPLPVNLRGSFIGIQKSH